MKVLLIYPNGCQDVIGLGDLGAIAEPLALEYVAAVAGQEGHEVRLLDLRLHLDELDSTVAAFRPDVVGVTGYSMHVLRNLEICGRAKALLPHCRTIVGGHHASLLPEDFFQPQIDFIAVGAGLEAFRALLRALEDGRLDRPIPDLWSRQSDGTFRFGGEGPPFDIDRQPWPDRSLVPEDRRRYYIDWMSPIAMLRTTVGCPYRCSFCSLWTIQHGRYLKRDIRQVVAELSAIEETFVFLVDDEPFISPARMAALADAIAAAGIEKQYFAYCRIDSFLKSPDLMRRWREVGLRRVFIGIETIFDEELKDYNKRQELEEIVQAMKLARELDIALFSNFIVRPDYTRREFDQLIAFIRRHRVDYPSFTVLTPIPGTEAGRSFDAILRRQPNGRPDWNYFDLQHAVTPTRLPASAFQREYHRLKMTFADSYQKAGHPLFQTESLRSRAGGPASCPPGPGAPPP